MTSDAVRLTAEERHRVLMETLRPRIAGDPVISHASAAVLHQLPLPRVHLGQIHVTRPAPSKGHRGAQLHAHTTALAQEEIVDVGGWAVTSVARTVLDLARTLPFEQAVVAADAALHRALVTPESLAAQLLLGRRLPGARAASRAIKFADGRAESVGESRSRVMIHRAGLPRPELQVEVRTDDGLLIARGDFGYRRQRVLGEFDGRVKYTGELEPGHDPAEVLFREKLREDAVRDLGWSVVRWVWADLDEPAAVVARLQKALRRTSG